MEKNIWDLGMTDMSQAFSMFMDSAKMKAIFQHELPDCVSGGWELTDCKIQHPRYKTYLNPDSRSKSFLAAAYYLKGTIQPTQKPQDGIVYVKAYLGERGMVEYERSCSEFKNSTQNAPIYIEKYGMVTWFFPDDPSFPSLSTVMDVARMQSYFADVLFTGKSGFAGGIKNISVQIINYRPEIRCTYRYDLALHSGAKKVLYGKTFADEKGAEIYSRILILQQHCYRKVDCFTLPKPVAYDASLHTLWMEELPGVPVIDVINKGNSTQLLMQAARYLADFQQAEINGLETISEDYLLAEIEKKSAKLKIAFPDLAARFETIISNLAQQKVRLPHVPYQLIHGDFHIQQLLRLPDNRMALFDFDELAFASPLVDVANFSADLFTLSIKNDCTWSRVHSFFKGYQSISNYALTDAQFDWHLRAQLLTRAYRAYIQQKTDNVTVVEQFLQLAEQGYVNNKAGMDSDV